MNDKEPVASSDDSRKTNINISERTVATPHFDQTTLRQARPAVPIATDRSKRFWPVVVVVAALVAGLAGGVIGAFIATSHLSRNAAPASTDAPIKNEMTEIDAPSSEVIPQSAVPDRIEEATRTLNASEPEAQTSVPESEDREDEVKSSAKVGTESDDALRAALNEWVAATNARDLNKQMGFYNQRINAFYQARDVGLEIVRADKARTYQRAQSIDVRAGVPSISFSRDGRTAIMRFRKQYNIMGGGEDRAGEVLQELRWRRINGNWRIVSERDIRVIH